MSLRPSPRSLSGLLCLIFLVLLAGGCWDQVGIADRTLVIGLGIDLIEGDEPICLTVQVIDFNAFRTGNGSMMGGTSAAGNRGSGGDSTNGAVIIETSQGRSLAEAVHNLLAQSSRRILFSHNRIVILGNALARADIADVFDMLARDNQFRPTSWILTAEATAKEILEAKTDLGAIPAHEIDKMMLNMTKNALIMPVNQNDLIFRLNSETKTGTIPLIRIDKREGGPEGRIRIDRSAVFKDNRLIGLLTREESEGLLWLTEQHKGGLVVFPGSAADKPAEISVEITDGATHIIPRIVDDEIVMDITCTGHAILREAKGLAGDPPAIRRLEQSTERILTGRVERTIEKARLLKADFPGFGNLIHAEYPERWHLLRRAWGEKISGIKTSVRFQIDLARYGTIRDSALRP